MAYSTIPAAVDQLLVTIAARLAASSITGVSVIDGRSASLPESNEYVIVDDAVNWKMDWAQLGQRRIEETYTVKVIVAVFYASPDEAEEHRSACRHRLFALIAEVQQAAVVDVTLDGILAFGVKPNGGDPRIFPSDGGWVGDVTLNLDCSARIQAS